MLREINLKSVILHRTFRPVAKFVIVQDKVEEENSEAGWQQSQFKRELQSLHRVNQCCSMHSRAASFENVIFGKVLRRFLRKSGTKRSFNQVCRSSPLANKNVPSVLSLVSSHLSYFVRCCQMIQNESESEKMFSVFPRPSSWQDVIAENIPNN